MTKQKTPDNQWSTIAFLVNHYLKLIAILLTAGIITFALQMKSFQCGDAKIEKQTLKQTLNK